MTPVAEETTTTPAPARKRVRKATKKAAPRKRAKAKVERKWRSLSEKDVSQGRKTLRAKTKAGTESGFISEFAREHGITNVTAFLALRGRTYRYLKTPGVMISGKPAKVEARKQA